MIADPSRELLTIQQAMARVKVTRRTIYNWLHKGLLRTERTVGGQVRIDADSLWRARPDDPTSRRDT